MNLEAAIKKFKTPRAVQKFLRSMPYNSEKGGESLRSAAGTLKAQTAHCFEATFLAAAILEHHGYPPLALSLESKDGIDHVLFLFKESSGWGAIGRSRDQGLHGRAPVFKSLKALAQSYYAPYIDKTGEARSYQIFHLDETQTDWRLGKTNIWEAEQYLIGLKHLPLKNSKQKYKRLFKNYKLKGPLTEGPHWW